MRIAFLGGGSFQWTPTLVTDVLTMPSLAGTRPHLVLEDIDPRPLPTLEAYARKAAETIGVEATVSTTTDQRAAVGGGQPVWVCIPTGGSDSRRPALDVPERYGIR